MLGINRILRSSLPACAGTLVGVFVALATPGLRAAALGPNLTLTSLTEGMMVGGIQKLAASADGEGLVDLQFQVSSQNVGQSITAGACQMDWNTSLMTDGPYTVSAVAHDDLGNTLYAQPVTVNVANSVAELSAVQVSNITDAAATVSWTSNLTADSQVEYGVTAAYGSTTARDLTLVTTHSQTLTGLAAGQTYHVRVRSRNWQDMLSVSPEVTFTTTAPVQAQAPPTTPDPTPVVQPTPEPPTPPTPPTPPAPEPTLSVASPAPAPIPEPTPAPAPTPTPTPVVPAVIPPPTPTTPAPVSTPAAPVTPTPAPPVTPTPTPTPAPTPAVIPTPTPTPTPAPAPTPVALPTPVAAPAPVSAPTPVPTPAPVVTPPAPPAPAVVPPAAPTLAAPVSTCLTPDPFAAMGGGTCRNGGWLPPGSSPAPAPAPTPAPAAAAPAPSFPLSVAASTCQTPDPFAAMGGGTCYNGGWLPPGVFVVSVPVTTPAPAPSAATSATPAPSPAPSSSPEPSPAPVAAPVQSVTTVPVSDSSSCFTPDPFAAMGGGSCVSGGWLPPGLRQTSTSLNTVAVSVPSISSSSPSPVSTSVSSTSGGCSTPDPFATIATLRGVCMGGGWVPVLR